MNIELSDVDLEIIKGWYLCAEGRSAAAADDETFGLMEKLGIMPYGGHLREPNPEHYHPEYRHEAFAIIAAIRAYRSRHPEIK